MACITNFDVIMYLFFRRTFFCLSDVETTVIEELAISDQETPGQVHAFLSFHPSFVKFRRLRKIYIHFLLRPSIGICSEEQFIISKIHLLKVYRLKQKKICRIAIGGRQPFCLFYVYAALKSFVFSLDSIISLGKN